MENKVITIWTKSSFDRLSADTDLKTANEILAIFLQTLRAATYKTKLNPNDLKEIRRIAHRLRPGAELLGFDRFALKCYILEQRIAESTPNQESLDQVNSWQLEAAELIEYIENDLHAP